MKKFSTPRVVVSNCLGFAACRYNGEMVNEPLVNYLKQFIDVIPVCPEVDIGLGTPRPPIHIISSKGGYRLVQPETSTDLTELMEQYSTSFLGSLPEIDGFILKSRSPSCGLYDTKIFSDPEKNIVLKKGSGFLGKRVLGNYSHLAIEDEERLKSYPVWNHFLTKLFTLAKYRTLKEGNSIKDLVNFQSENKYLFMAYNQIKQKELGRIIANPQRNQLADVYKAYEEALYGILKNPPSIGTNVNVLQHIMGYFSKELSSEERSYGHVIIEGYREGKVPFTEAVAVLKSWSWRFNEQYLIKQTFFEPYPKDLQEKYALVDRELDKSLGLS